MICGFTFFEKNKFFLKNRLTNRINSDIINNVVNARVAESADAHV